jgi:hypothetical protein
MKTGENRIADLANGVTFSRVDGKEDVEYSNKPLLILNPAKGTIKKGDKIVGVFRKTVISETYGTPSYIIATDDNDVLINGCGSLNKQMENVKEDELIQVEYRGAEPMKDGKFKGKKSHLYTVRRATDLASDNEESAS